jgi:hypothetical protein
MAALRVRRSTSSASARRRGERDGGRGSGRVRQPEDPSAPHGAHPRRTASSRWRGGAPVRGPTTSCSPRRRAEFSAPATSAPGRTLGCPHDAHKSISAMGTVWARDKISDLAGHARTAMTCENMGGAGGARTHDPGIMSQTAHVSAVTGPDRSAAFLQVPALREHAAPLVPASRPPPGRPGRPCGGTACLGSGPGPVRRGPAGRRVQTSSVGTVAGLRHDRVVNGLNAGATRREAAG